MNSAPHLRLEDRPEFERVLDEALRTMARPDNSARPRLSSAQLRALAIADAAKIAATAASEYDEYVRVRERLRQSTPAANTPGGLSGPGGNGSSLPSQNGPGDGSSLVDSVDSDDGAGLFAVVAVLMPVLAGAAALIFLLVGYVLGLFSPEPSLAEPMRNVGWVFAVVMVIFGVIGATSLLLTASRNAPTARQGANTSQESVTDEVSVARAAWRYALTQRGIHPYLREVQVRYAENDGSLRPPAPRGSLDDDGRNPRLGYSRPNFAASAEAREADEEGSEASERNRYSSPKYSSSGFSSPKYSTEDGSSEDSSNTKADGSSGRRYSSPDFSAPTTDGRGSGDDEGRRYSSPSYRSGSTQGRKAEAQGHRFASPKFASGATDSPAEDGEGHRFASPKFASGATDSPAEDGEGHRFASPKFATPGGAGRASEAGESGRAGSSGESDKS